MTEVDRGRNGNQKEEVILEKQKIMKIESRSWPTLTRLPFGIGPMRFRFWGVRDDEDDEEEDKAILANSSNG